VPIDLRIEVLDAAGERLVPEGIDAQMRIGLPVVVDPAEGASNAAFAWLQGFYVEDPSTGIRNVFLGYMLPSLDFDPDSGLLYANLGLDEVEGTLFLPAWVTPGFVQNHDPSAQIWSGPTSGARSFGVAAPQFTTFTVVAPQISTRLYVFNPATQNFGWIDVLGVGPSGPPSGG
jgi:hypothetical protein